MKLHLQELNVSCTYEGQVTNKVYPESFPRHNNTFRESGTGVSDVVNRANTLTTTITDVITNGSYCTSGARKS